MTNVAPPDTKTLNQPKRVKTVVGIAYSIVINAVFPYFIYIFLKGNTHATDFEALVASSVPPILDSIVSVIRKGHIDFIAGIVLLGIMV